MSKSKQKTRSKNKSRSISRSKKRIIPRSRSTFSEVVEHENSNTIDTFPSPKEIQNLVLRADMKIHDKIVVLKLQRICKTFLYKILRSLPPNNHIRVIKLQGIRKSVIHLFGQRFHDDIDSSIKTGSLVVSKQRFRKMVNESLDILFDKIKSLSVECLDYLQYSVEFIVFNAFLAPVKNWKDVDKKSKKILTMEDLKKVNQVYSASKSEFYAQSLVQS